LTRSCDSRRLVQASSVGHGNIQVMGRTCNLWLIMLYYFNLEKDNDEIQWRNWITSHLYAFKEQRRFMMYCNSTLYCIKGVLYAQYFSLAKNMPRGRPAKKSRVNGLLSFLRANRPTCRILNNKILIIGGDIRILDFPGGARPKVGWNLLI